MRFALIVELPEIEQEAAIASGLPRQPRAVFGSFKTAAAAHQVARAASRAGARTEVLPIHPGRAFDAATPNQPKETT